MAKIIDLPKLSPTMEEGTLVRWARHVGDAVGIDDLLAEVETDKATMEFRAFDKGTLLAVLVAEGAVASLGQPVAVLGEPGEDITEILASLKKTVPPPATQGAATPSAMAPAEQAPAAETEPPVEPVEAPAEAPAETPAKAPAKAKAEAPAVAPTAAPAVPPTVHGSAGVAGAILAPTTPRVRRIAREMVLDLAAVPGSGEHGRVSENDLRSATALAAVSDRSDDTLRPVSPTRKTIARRLTEAWQTVPHFYLEADLDAGPLMTLRERLNDGAAPDAKVSVNDFFLKAAALALREVPEANASWVDGKIIEHHRTDISMAVAIEGGLVTPVLRDVHLLSIRVVAARARDLAGRARARKLKPEEMTHGVFSVSNLGMFQIDRFAAVINPPEGMILAVGAVRDVPVVHEGAVVPGKRCAVTLSCDHRVVDGALGASFLLALRKLIENPLRVV